MRNSGLCSAQAVLGAKQDTIEALKQAGIPIIVAKKVVTHILQAAEGAGKSKKSDKRTTADNENEHPNGTCMNDGKQEQKPSALGPSRLVNSTNLSAKRVKIRSTKKPNNLRMDIGEWAKKAQEKKAAAKELREQRMFGLGVPRMNDTTAGLGPTSNVPGAGVPLM